MARWAVGRIPACVGSEWVSMPAANNPKGDLAESTGREESMQAKFAGSRRVCGQQMRSVIVGDICSGKRHLRWHETVHGSRRCLQVTEESACNK